LSYFTFPFALRSEKLPRVRRRSPFNNIVIFTMTTVKMLLFMVHENLLASEGERSYFPLRSYSLGNPYLKVSVWETLRGSKLSRDTNLLTDVLSSHSLI